MAVSNGLKGAKCKNKTTIESTKSGTTKRDNSWRKIEPVRHNKEEVNPIKSLEISKIIEEEDKKLDEVVMNSPKQDSDRCEVDSKFLIGTSWFNISI